ncbi:MAG: DUF362 domain-containing protein [Clostridia bacterium]|nr:DUF362 domain-containing protein [Clostridia bacterium]
MIFNTDWDFDISSLIENPHIPEVYRIHQIFENSEISDVGAYTASEVKKKLENVDIRGKRIAITVGSRGITGLPEMVSALTCVLKEKGGNPFVVPAMGSHAGATDKGQKAYIENLGIREEVTGCPIISSMDTVILGTLSDGMPVYCDRNAAEADCIIVMNKIKPHANFKGNIESGLCKMLGIGLSKRDGAAMLHRRGYSVFTEKLTEIGHFYEKSGRILFGIGIVENAYDRPMAIEVVDSNEIVEREKELLEMAKANMPLILCSNIDVLVVDQIGKNISGQGMDPNVTGRSGSPLRRSFNEDFIDRITVLGLTEETHGIFPGLGMADFAPVGVTDGLDFKGSYTNEITSRTTPPARLPLFTKNDEQAVQLAVYACEAGFTGDVGLVHIKDTSHLDEIEVSEKILKQMNPSRYEILEELHPLEFTDGRLKRI